MKSKDGNLEACRVMKMFEREYDEDMEMREERD